ncbi:UPF0481 protein At3g47200-like [Carex rostrata]
MEEAQIDVAGLVTSLQCQLDTLWGNANKAENFTIFRTPHYISQSKKKLFEPSVISIGPFHRGQPHLQALEEQKRRFLRDLLSRGDNISLDLCISEMKLLETRTRRCYSEMLDDLNSHEFVEMMLLDGCFLLEYCLKSIDGNWNPILEIGWKSNFIKSDLVLQDNQIPFFIVDKLYELIFNQDHRMIFVKYIPYNLLPNDSVFPDIPTETPDTIDSIIADPPAEIPDSTNSTIHSKLDKIPDPPHEIHHLVHLCYHCLVSNPEEPLVLISTMFRANSLIHQFLSRVLKRRSPHSTSRSLSVPLPNSSRNISSMLIPSAMALKQMGVKFKPKNNPKHMLDISFEYGVIKIPTLKFHDTTKFIFANLIAFEHSKYGKEHSPFTSFVVFLDKPVNTAKDVTILQECGIIENWLGSEDELTQFINQATEGTTFSRNHYLAELYTEVNRYAESSWHRNRAKLIRDYFHSPWATISVVAAIILLVLTLVQSFFAVFAYFHLPNP